MICALAIALLTSPVDQTGDELLEKVKKAYKEVKTASYKTDATIFTNPEIKCRSEVVYATPNRVHAKVNIDRGGEKLENVATTDGKTLVRSMKDGLKKEPYKPRDLLGCFAGYWESIAFWDIERLLSRERGSMSEGSVFTASTEAWEGKAWLILTETSETRKSVARYFVDPKTYIIHRSQLQLGDQKAVDSRILDLKLNEKVDEGLFKVALQ
jgi:outer membrane lipoprotein-sorting protein